MSREAKISKYLFSTLMVGVFAVLFGPSVLAQFARQDGPVGWGYGYGYGFSYGYGWDAGTQAGYMTDQVGSNSPVSNIAYRFTPDGNTYSVSSIAFDPTTLDGEAVTEGDVSGDNDDEVTDPIAMPFAFQFFGSSKTSYRLSSNGFLSFANDGDDGCCNGKRIPSNNTPNDMIAAAWMDLSSSGSIRHEVFGETGSRTLVIEFARPEYDGDAGSVSVQLQLHEETNVIDIHTTLIDNRHHDVTQGLENTNGSRGVASPGLNRRFAMDEVPLYGIGYGRMLPRNDNESAISYDADTDTYNISSAAAGSIFQAGLATPRGGEEGSVALATANSFRMQANVRIHVGENHTVLFHNGDEWDLDDLSDISPFRATTDIDTSGLQSVYAQLTFGVPGNHFVSDDAHVTVRAAVSGELNGQTLSVARRSHAEAAWSKHWGTCVVSEGICEFEADALEDYAVTAYVSSGGNNEHTASIDLYSPNGGQSYTHGTTHQILWASAGSDIQSIKLSLSTDGGSSWDTIASNEYNDGSYAWLVPDSATTKAKILLEARGVGDAALASDLSDNVFTIVGTEKQNNEGGGGGGGGGGPMGGGSGDEHTGTSNDADGSDTSSTGAHALPRAEANAHLPEAFPVDTLVKLADDHNVDTASDSTVYFIGLDAKRHPFISTLGYLSWYRDFSPVHIIDSATLASIPLGAPILVRPGTYWVKITSDPKTYYVEPGYRLRWIKDEATARALGGERWNTGIIDIDPAYFTLFHSGPDIDTTYLASSWPSGSLVSSPANLAIRYYITGGHKRAFNPDSAFGTNGFQDRFVQAVDAPGWQGLPAGTDIAGTEDAIFSLLH
jgi:hypothetical protein